MKKAFAVFFFISTLPSCVVIDVVEGFRQFGGESPSKYAEWRNWQKERRFEKGRKP